MDEKMDRLYGIVAECLEVDRELIDEASGPGNPEDWDSVGHVSVVSAVEQAYGVTLTMTETLEIQTVADLAALLEKKGTAPSL